MLSLKVLRQDFPESRIVIRALYRDACLLGTGNTTTAHALPPHIAREEDVRSKIPRHDTGPALMIERIEVFLSRKAMIDPGDALVADVMEAIATQTVVQFAKQPERLNHRQTRAHHQSAIGEAIVRAECIARLVGRQDSHQTAIIVEHQRMILEAVGMIVHIAAVEEKSSILRRCHKLIPLIGLLRGISLYLEHPI